MKVVGEAARERAGVVRHIENVPRSWELTSNLPRQRRRQSPRAREMVRSHTHTAPFSIAFH